MGRQRDRVLATRCERRDRGQSTLEQRGNGRTELVEEITQLKALLRVEPNISHRGVPPVYVHTSSSVVDALSATNRVPTATIRPIPVEANLVAHQCNSHPAASSPRARRRRHRDSLPFPACRVAGRDICHGWGWDPYIGRVGGLTVALGVGAAIAAGWGSGLAWVDDAGRSSESAASATDSGAGPRRRSAVQPAALITGLRSRSNPRRVAPPPPAEMQARTTRATWSGGRLRRHRPVMPRGPTPPRRHTKERNFGLPPSARDSSSVCALTPVE